MKEVVESLASALMAVDETDLQELGSIHTLFEKVAAEAGYAVGESAATLAKNAVELVQDVMLDDVEDKTGALETVGLAVSALQGGLQSGDDALAAAAPESLLNKPQGSRELPAYVDEAILSEFLARQESVMEELEESALAMEGSGDQEAGLATIKRILHTVKGETAVLGLNSTSQLCHKVEDYIEQSSGNPKVDVLLAVKDWLNQSFSAVQGRNPMPASADELLPSLGLGDGLILPAEETADTTERTPVDTVEEPSAGDAETKTYSLAEVDQSLLADFINETREHLDASDEHLLTMENDPENVGSLSALFRAFHTVKSVAGFLSLVEVSSLAHATEDLLDLARKGSLKLTGTVIDVVFEAIDTMRQLADAVEEAISSGQELKTNPAVTELVERIKKAPSARRSSDKKLGEILVESGRVSTQEVARAVEKQKDSGDPTPKLGEILVDNGATTAADVSEALRIQQAAKHGRIKEMIKIDTEDLDKMLDAIGELVITESMVCQDEDILAHASLRAKRNLALLGKITRELQELGAAMRMTPIRSTFNKMARLIRDLAKKANKEVVFVTVGEDTEMDRLVVEKIGDPLIHMVRNSLDHGVETTEERIKAGKSPKGKVKLRAFHRGGSIFIELEDDGRGLDRDAIFNRAVERGIVDKDADLPDEDIFKFIFAAGFSTAKHITDVSGRGVGMDVVRRNIKALRGSVEIASKKSEGTTISIRLPLTLAIIDGMVIKIGAERFIIPTLSIVESFQPGPEDISTVAGIGKRMRALDIDSPKTYYNYLTSDTSGRELVNFIDAISTNVTHFFREAEHFDVLGSLLREWEAQGQKRFRIWCAASSTGEEPYSLAITVRENLSPNANVKILATDISTKVLKDASEGVYEEKHLDKVPLPLRRKYFQKGSGSAAGRYKVKPILRQLLTFGRLNLSVHPYRLRGPLDVIFCRNVIIYFTDEIRTDILYDMYALLKPEGYLMVGHAESLTGMVSPFNLVRPAVYIKK
ncbi:CheR family methyltransferase [Candidatus Hydrogenedentota bacterium]